MYGISGDGTHSEHGAEKVRSRTQMRDRAKKFGRMTLFLKRIFGNGLSAYAYPLRLYLKRLLVLGGQFDGSFDFDRGADAERGYLLVIFDLRRLKNDLNGLEITSVVQFDKTESL